MGLNCASSLIKYILFIFNLICAVGGIALITVGAIALRKVSDIKGVFENHDHPGYYAAVIIALGALLFVISFFGCMGSIRESQCLLNLYSLCLLALVVLQVLIAIFAFLYNEDIQRVALKNWDRLWIGRENPLNNKTIDQLQTAIQCCGSSSFLDYGVNIPSSCCPSDTNTCNILLSYKIGCKEQIRSGIQNSASLIAYTSIGIAIIELIAVVFSCCLSSNIRNSSRLTF